MQRGPDCLSGSQTTAGLVSLDAFARSKDATPSPPLRSHFHPWWCTPPVLLGCLASVSAAANCLLMRLATTRVRSPLSHPCALRIAPNAPDRNLSSARSLSHHGRAP